MAPTIVKLPFVAGPAPAGWKATSGTAQASTPETKYEVYPAGPSFIGHARRQIQKLSFEEDDKIQAELHHELAKAKLIEAGEELYPGLGEEVEDRATLAYDPKEWKKQDHYAVLGLGNLRYLATEDHIRVAHRRKVLRHHPDKKAGTSSGGSNDDSFFKCIAKAFEVLTNPETRRQFDSIDPTIEDYVPNPKDVTAEDFVHTYAPVFAREARFSKTQPVPGLGEMDAQKADVEKFYDFWYNFDSWRSFEMWDKEVTEGSDSRDEKRYQEKKNKAERARAKKEDNTRLREMVDMILASDPRIKRFRQEEKAAREAKKAASGKPGAPAAGKPMTLQQKKAAEAAKLQDLKKQQEEHKAKEAEDKVSREAAKKAKEAAKKNLKKWKKAITTVVSESNYFQAEGTSPSAQVIEKQLAEIDALVEALDPEQVKGLKEEVDKAGKGQAAKEAIKARVASVEDKSKFSEFA